MAPEFVAAFDLEVDIAEQVGLALASVVQASFVVAFDLVALASAAVAASEASADRVAFEVGNLQEVAPCFDRVACLEPSVEDRYPAAASVDIADFVAALPTPPVIAVKFLLHHLASFFLFVILFDGPVERPPQ